MRERGNPKGLTLDTPARYRIRVKGQPDGLWSDRLGGRKQDPNDTDQRRGCTVKEIVYFVLGAAVGATFALLFAPKSGAELRADLQATAEKDLSRLQAAMAKTNERLDQMQADLKQALQQAQEEEAEAA